MKYSDELLIEYMEGTLDSQTTNEIDQWLEGSHNGQARLAQLRELLHSMQNSVQYDPSERLDWEFQTMLQEEIGRQSKSRKNIWMKFAAAVTLLIVGFAVGKFMPAENDQQSEQLTSLQGQINDLQQLVMMGTLRDHSASERLQTVSLIENSEIMISDDLISTLVRTMSNDDSPNVRYAAVQALGRFLNLENVRMEMVRALDHQTDPLIQIAMINLLVQAEEKSAIAPIRKIIEQEGTADEVKRQAEIAIEILI